MTYAEKVAVVAEDIKAGKVKSVANGKLKAKYGFRDSVSTKIRVSLANMKPPLVIKKGNRYKIAELPAQPEIMK